MGRIERTYAGRTTTSALFIGSVFSICTAIGCSSDAAKGQILGGGGDGSSAGNGSGATNDSGAGNSAAGKGTTPGANGGSGAMPLPSTTPEIPLPGTGVPAKPGTTTLTLSDAPDLGTINYVPNRSSVRLYLPGVAGARDYRVFAVEDGVSVRVDDQKREHVEGGTIQCAGLRQRNQCDEGEILPIKYNNELLDMPKCQVNGLDRRPNVPTSLMQTLEVNGIGANATLVVEAIDRQCPFPGLVGNSHQDIPIFATDVGPSMVQATINDKSYDLQLLPKTFPIVTEKEIRAQYGSMILNGQGPNQPTLDPKSPNFPESPYVRLGQPAPADDPIVLARSVVTVSPSGTDKPPAGFSATDYFDDFEDNTDQPVLLRSTDYANKIIGIGSLIHVYTTKKWVLYDEGCQFSDFSVDRGAMNMVFGDGSQATMSIQAMYPKRPVQLPNAADQYLHVTYEVQREETARRYENLTLCGADTVGETYDGEIPKASPAPHPGFMNEMDTARTSVLGWNCLLFVPRGAGYGVLPGGDIKSHADTALKITVVRSSPPPTAENYDSQHLTKYTNAYGPSLEPAYPLRWMRQVDASGAPVGPWLDDQQNVWQRTRTDVFIRRDRVVIYVEGEQRICQDLDPTAMTMAEGALGFWHTLYHTSAEFTESRSGLEGSNPSTGQHHALHNVPFADLRTYDNVGFRENVGLPANFDPSVCRKAD